MKRPKTDWIIIHCSATKNSDASIDVDRIREWHLAKGWSDIGYQFVIPRNGALQPGRPLEDVGAHVLGFNSTSVGICLVGGLDDNGYATEGIEFFTAAQLETLTMAVNFLKKLYPGAKVRGHRDFSPDLDGDGRITKSEWMKNCPTFNVGDYFE